MGAAATACVRKDVLSSEVQELELKVTTMAAETGYTQNDGYADR